MELHEKQLKLQALDMSLEALDNIIDNMKKANYSQQQINEYVKKRWEVWNEIYQVKKS